VLDVLRFFLMRTALSLADRTVTSPLFSWSWSGVSQGKYAGRLSDFRPTDSQSVIEMMDGKYLLANHMIDTHGVSPFATDTDDDEWFEDLQAFGWLRHFSELRDGGQRRFARTLVTDWIGRYGDFDREAWAVFITARRILNWLKNYDLIVEGANPEQIKTIARSLAAQIQSLRVRQALTTEPLARLMSAIALVGAAVCAEEKPKELVALSEKLAQMLDNQLDADGMHLSRNPHSQIQLLSELIPVNQALNARHPEGGAVIARKVEAMHRALDRLLLGTREIAYVNGCGQLPVDLVLAIAAQSGARSIGSGLSGGYGVLVDGRGKVVADCGRVPPLGFADNAHAGALSFEFACGGTLVVGNCGPAPSQLPESATMFRHTAAHSAPTIDDVSSARLGGLGLAGDLLRLRGAQPRIEIDLAGNAIEMASEAYRQRYGLDLARRLTLMGGGQTLVGQDRFTAAGRKAPRQGDYIIRFHLDQGAVPERDENDQMIRIEFRSGEVWAFLWEGAQAEIEESVRHSAWFGLVRTFQIVLSGPARPETEIAWVFTQQSV
jgi:uncharacterized heparinase superfamily protein